MKKYVIYRATNTVNNKVYIGFDSAWPRRKAQHKHNVLYGAETSNAFYNAIRKYGWENFTWEVIYESGDGEHTLEVMENQFIIEHHSYLYAENSNGYNMTLGGEGTVGHRKSKHSIDAQKRKMIGRKQTEEHIRRRTKSRLSNPDNQNWNAGKTKQDDPRLAELALKISKALKGKKKTQSHKDAMRLRPQDVTSLTCPHCNKVGDYKNMKRWHMDNCKSNPNLKHKENKSITCTKCGYITQKNPNFYKHHNERCKNEA